MKQNKVIVVLVLIIILLVGFLIYERIPKNKSQEEDEEIKLVSQINLDYLDIYLTSDGLAYLVPLKSDEIKQLDISKNLKDRLNTLYERAFYYDIYLDNYKIKGFKIMLDDKITKINQINKNDNTYIIFLKENNTLGILDYLKYLDDLDTNVIDNYNNIKNVQDIKEDNIIYLDGNKEELKLD